MNNNHKNNKNFNNNDNNRYVVQGTNGQTVYGPKNKTESWQPIDAGHIGAIYKSLIRCEQELWMDRNHTIDAEHSEYPIAN